MSSVYCISVHFTQATSRKSKGFRALPEETSSTALGIRVQDSVIGIPKTSQAPEVASGVTPSRTRQHLLPAPRLDSTGGSERIPLMEDDKFTCHAGEKNLCRQRLYVLTAADAEDGRHRNPIRPASFCSMGSDTKA